MSHQENITIDLGPRSYEIVVSAGSIKNLAAQNAFSDGNHFVVIADENVAALYLESVRQQLESLGIRVDCITVPAGEASKSIARLDALWNRLLEINTDRRSTIVTLGGGVVGDLGGFAAASFARGLPFIQIPTSLLAQVDSSVGGKVGINLPGAKNLVGAFWQPRFVLIDPDVLSTLDETDYISGIAEIIKYAMIMDRDFFEFLSENMAAIRSRDHETLTRVVSKCCRLKAEIVAEDEREVSGRRAILNYGHTFGHAIENVFGYGAYLHGQAVAVGMQCAARLAQERKLVDGQFIEQQTNLLKAAGLPLKIDNGKETELVAAMHRDKKVVGGKLMLVLPTAIGSVGIFESPGDDALNRAFHESG